MSYKIEGISLKRHTSNEDKLCCEVCQNASTDIYRCNHCHLFCCSTCTKGHLCPHQALEGTFKFERIQTDNRKPLELCKKISEGGNPRFLDFSSAKNEWNRSCLRCYITLATKVCLKCKIKYYCQHCFKSIHTSSKLSSHQSLQICQNKDIITSKGDNQVKMLTKSLNNQQKNQFNQSDTLAQRESSYKDLLANLSLIKSEIICEYSNHESELRESINIINSTFQHLMEDIKLKMFEITMKIKEHFNNTLQRLDVSKEMANSQQKALKNLLYIQKQGQSLIPIDVLQAKKETCQREINTLSQFNIFKDPVDKRHIEISQQIEQIREKINKIALKKIGLHMQRLDSSKISTVSNTTSRNEKNSNYFVLPLNLANIKPNDKLTMSLITPKKAQNVMKSPKQFENNSINKSLFLSQSVINCPEDNIQKSIKSMKGSNIDSNKKLQKKKIDNFYDKRIFPTALMSPKASIKKFDKNMENNTKSKITKTGMNIEKTKKMIKDIRNEMVEFSSRFNERQPSQCFNTEEQSNDISQLSIESVLQKSIKL